MLKNDNAETVLANQRQQRRQNFLITLARSGKYGAEQTEVHRW